MEIKIVHFDAKFLEGFYSFSRLVHPKEKGLETRMKWFTFGNPLNNSDPRLPGLAVTLGDQVIGQFLMAPFEFHLRGKKHMGHFGYDFFVKEEYRSRGAGALLFVQGVRMYAPFVGVGLTHIVEKISKAAGIQTLGQIQKYIWAANPLVLGSKFLKTKFMGAPSKITLDGADERFPDRVESYGIPFMKITEIPQGVGQSFSSETLEPVRDPNFLKWRFADSPWPYHVYSHRFGTTRMFLVVRSAVYQGTRLLLIVDYRIDHEKFDQLDVLLQAAQAIARQVRLDGVVMACTHPSVGDALRRQRFTAAGKPSSVIAYLPKTDFPLEVNSVCLTMADADLDFSFGETP